MCFDAFIYIVCMCLGCDRLIDLPSFYTLFHFIKLIFADQVKKFLPWTIRTGISINGIPNFI